MPHLKLDESLLAMIRENESIIRGFMHCGGGESLWDAEIAWDSPAQVSGDEWTEDDAKLSHAIGFLSGVAAAMDVTPLELLDVVHETDKLKRYVEAFPKDVPGLAQSQQHSKRTGKVRDPSQRRQRLPKVR